MDLKPIRYFKEDIMRRKRDEVYIDTQDIIGTTIGYWKVLEYSHKSITYSGSRKLTRH